KRWREALEADSNDLVTLREAEKSAFEEDDAATIASIETALARVLGGPEGSAHAMLAARMQHRAAGWESTFDAVKLAAAAAPKAPWTLRNLASHAHAKGDLDGFWHAMSDLAERTERPLERATLLVRAAEAALASGDDASATTLLSDALGAYP